MYVLMTGVGELDQDETTTRYTNNKKDVKHYAEDLLKLHPDYIVNVYKLAGKFAGTVTMKMSEYVVNEKGEVLPA